MNRFSFYGLFVIVVLLSVVLLFALAEVLTRLFLGDQINVQYTTRNLYKEKSYSSKTDGWLPYAKGSSCGKNVRINSLGLRGPEVNLNSRENKILLLGDSVLFGPGIDEEGTVAELLRTTLNACIINTSVIGFSTSNYVDVLQIWMQKAKLDRVLVFFSLNDIQNDTTFVQRSKSSDIIGFLLRQVRSRSKFYMALKNAISDRSKVYFLYDQQYYTPNNSRFIQAIQDLSTLRDICNLSKVKFDVIILPYEYQLRNRQQNGIWSPQTLLKNYLDVKGIDYLEIDFPTYQGEKLKELYLYADGIHFSPKGHQLIAEQVAHYLATAY